MKGQEGAAFGSGRWSAASGVSDLSPSRSEFGRKTRRKFSNAKVEINAMINLRANAFTNIPLPGTLPTIAERGSAERLLLLLLIPMPPVDDDECCQDDDDDGVKLLIVEVWLRELIDADGANADTDDTATKAATETNRVIIIIVIPNKI